MQNLDRQNVRRLTVPSRRLVAPGDPRWGAYAASLGLGLGLPKPRFGGSGAPTGPSFSGLSSSSGLRYGGARTLQVQGGGFTPTTMPTINGTPATDIAGVSKSYVDTNKIDLLLPEDLFWESVSYTIGVPGAAGPPAPYDVVLGPTLAAIYTPGAGEATVSGIASHQPASGMAADSNRTATQSDPTKQPAIVTASPNMGGRRSYLYDGSNDFLVTGNWALPAGQPFTRVHAFYCTKSGSGLSDSFTNVAGQQARIYLTTMVWQYAGTSNVTNTPAALSTLHILASEYDGANSRSRINALTPQPIGNAGTGVNPSLVLGGNYGGGFPLGGEMGITIVMAGKDDAMIRQIMKGLGAFYGKTIGA